MALQSLLGKALQVAQGDVRYPLDAENAIRHFIIGRKIWLLPDTVKGAQANANLYSPIETAASNRTSTSPTPSAHCLRETVEHLETLLPWNVTRS